MPWTDIMLGTLVGGYFLLLGLGAKLEPKAARGNKWIAGFGVLILAGNFLLTMVEFKATQHHVTGNDMVAALKKRLNLPLQIDAITRLENVKAVEDRVIYQFVVMADDAAAFERKAAEMRSYMQKNGCTMQDNIIMFKSGLTMRMEYIPPMKLDLPEEHFTLTPADCGYKNSEMQKIK